MKLISFAALWLVVSLALLQASPREAQGGVKITRNEAQHLALKRFPGGQVKAVKLEKVEGKLVWSMAIAKPKSKALTAVAVDAMTGRIASVEKARP